MNRKSLKSVAFLSLLVGGMILSVTAGAQPASPDVHRQEEPGFTVVSVAVGDQPTEKKDSSVEAFRDPFAETDQVELSDPIKPWNKAITVFNRYTYNYVGIPVARTYRDYVPLLVRDSVKNFFDNLYEPKYMVNAMLQGEWHDAGASASRLVINTTAGGLGFFDPASRYFSPTKRTFDQTMGKWGISPGFYVVWPIIGPSSVRGTVGFVGDKALDPILYLEDDETVVALTTFRTVSEISYNIDRYETLEKYSVNYYSSVKNFYERKLYLQAQR